MPYKKAEIDSKHMGIGTVLKQYRLSVPPNQRNYSWGARDDRATDDPVTSLFADYAEAIPLGSYFLGTIVVTPTDGDVLELADGQQRLATSMIMLAAIRDYFCTHDEEDLAKSIEKDFLLGFDRRARETVPHLLLNISDREYFAKLVLSRPDDPARNIESTKPSHELIDRAAKHAAAKVKEIVAGQKPSVAIDRLIEWTEFIQDGAQIILVTAPDHLSAFVMFETLNDRGLDMSQVDLLKNHLFRLAENRISEAQQMWATAMSTLEMIEVSPLVYLRYLAIMLYGPTQEKALMRRIKKEVSSRQRAIELLQHIDENATTFVSIFSPEVSRGRDYGTSARRHLATLRTELKVEQIMPLVMAVASKFSIREAQKAFRMFVCWSVRFLVIGGRGGFFDKQYSDKAFAVGNGQIATANELADAMIHDKVVTPDGAFQAEFSTATVTRNHLARYYLRALELQAKDDPEPELIPNPSEEIVNLEHILPQSPSDDWNIDSELALGYYRKLGNLALLQASVNSEVGNAPFSQKRSFYKKSAFYLTSMVANEKEWGPEQIQKRQQRLAKLAVKTWPIR